MGIPLRESLCGTVVQVPTLEGIKAGIKVGSRDDVDTVFISCTSLRTSSVVSELESAIGKPVTSSNLCMAWHILACLGVPDREILEKRYGKLFACELPKNTNDSQ